MTPLVDYNNHTINTSYIRLTVFSDICPDSANKAKIFQERENMNILRKIPWRKYKSNNH